MEFFTGRLFDHVHLRVRNLEASLKFYQAVLEVLGVPISGQSHRHFSADELFVSPVDPGAEPTQRLHLAFQAKDPDVVKRFHAAAVAAGGKDNGGPGERHYHPGYYAAFVLDPDGNNVEVVHHGPSTRSAPAVRITPA